MKFRLTVEYKEFKGRNREQEGECIRLDDKNFTIRIDKSRPLISVVGTWFHEMAHLLMFTILRDSAIDEKREHQFCRRIDFAARRAFKKFLIGR